MPRTRTLIAHDLVDEVRLLIFPFASGTRGRLFDRTEPLGLVDSRPSVNASSR